MVNLYYARLFTPDSGDSLYPKTLKAMVIAKLTLVALLLGLLTLSSASIAKDRLTLCSENTLYPFVYLNGYKAAGILNDIAKSISKQLNIKIRVRPMDWNKCLDANKSGDVDGILGAGYTEERATYMQYPGSEGNPDTSLAIWAPVYSVVTSSAQTYGYNGDPTTIPTPIRIPTGFFIAKVLRNDGAVVTETSTGVQPNLITLASEQQGSVVMLNLLAKALSEKTFFKGNLSISDKPYTKAYFYVPFSKKSETGLKLKDRIWGAIKSKHNDKDFIKKIVDKNLERY